MPRITNAKPIDSPRCNRRLPEAALRYGRVFYVTEADLKTGRAR